ncbi:MAG: ABC transporter permease subunit [Betaproteobacteria bacterium]|nr:ABC transporter permease subunit [Betaproteobacteria bacterium]
MTPVFRKGGRRPPPPRPPLDPRTLWHSTSFRAIALQALVIIVVIGAAALMIENAMNALSKRGISTGFGFLTGEAGFRIGESLIRFDAEDSYLRAYAVAILNTLKVSILSVLLATLIGMIVGIGRLSRNWLISRLAAGYVELFRNTPQLVQIVFWYTAVTLLPNVRQAWNPVADVYLSKRGLTLPWPEAHPAWWWTLFAFAAAAGVVAWLSVRAKQRRRAGLSASIRGTQLAALLMAAPVATWLLAGAPAAISVPALAGFNFRGGATLSPEFLALLLGLSLYIAAFIAEIVRAGIQSVPRGQIEAANAIGLTRLHLYSRVILPQALRVMIPPATAQYVSTIKNSSLGVAIGYPELFNVSNTIITLSGNTVEAIVIMMAVYLTISFIIAALMNWYNHAVRIRER